MTKEKLEYGNKLLHNIKKAKEMLNAPISLDLVVRHAKETASVIGFLSPESVEKLKEEIKESIQKQIDEMQEKFDNL